MRKQFNDSSITIRYIQQLLNENYNSKISVTGEYYKNFDMNYGFAHYIAKYLDYKYPILDKKTANEYANIPEDDSTIRSIKQPISIMNYFLCNNTSGRLRYDEYYEPTQYVKNDEENENKNVIYRDIYNQYMILYGGYNDDHSEYRKTSPLYYEHGRGTNTVKRTYYIMNDQPLFSFREYNKETEEYDYSVKNNIIFTLSGWTKKKEICEIDDLVASYLIGRTITPNSSMEDIYYAQRLLIRDRNITREEKGIWCLPGAEGTEFDFTQTILNYQSTRVDPLSDNCLFVTGYFDIFTESCALKEIGSDANVIYGL